MTSKSFQLQMIIRRTSIQGPIKDTGGSRKNTARCAQHKDNIQVGASLKITNDGLINVEYLPSFGVQLL